MQEPHQEPLGAGSLVSVARRAGHEADIHFFRSAEEAVAHAVAERPQIIAFSVMTGAHRQYLDIIRRIKERIRTFSVFGGPHPTYVADIISDPGVDAVCRGEGEVAFEIFLEKFNDGNDFTSAPNFVFERDGEIIGNPPAPLVDDLDSLPFTDRGVFYSHEPLRRSHLKSFMAGRGCPFNCTYCFNHQYNAMYRGLGAIVRRRSADNVIAEILDVRARFPLGMIQFMDDTFILSGEWLEEFCEKYARRVGLPFFCNVRAELVTHEIVRDLKRGGCASVCLGIETGDPELRRRMLGRTQTDEQIRDAIALLRAHRIRVMTTNMLGIPGGGIASDWMTYHLNAECRVDYAWTSLTYPYPGTRIHELAIEAGIETPHPDTLTPSYFNVMSFDAPWRHESENLHRLLAPAANFPRLVPLARLLVRIRNPFARALYTLIFGFWKLYCYETRIFRRPNVWHALSADAVLRFVNNAALGFRMMFPEKNKKRRETV